MALRFNVKVGPWTAGDEGSFVDEVSVESPSAELVRLAAHAHDAGIIDVVEGLDVSHVQTQEAGEAAQAVSRGSWVERIWNADGTASPGYWDGPWGVGNQAQYDLEKAQLAVTVARVVGDPVAVAQAEADLAAVDADIQGRLAA